MGTPVAREPIGRTLPISAEAPTNLRVAMEINLNLHSGQNEREKSVGEDYARGIKTFKSLFLQYGHQKLADSLPELPQGSITDGTNETSATASGSSQPPPLETSQPDMAEFHMEEDSLYVLGRSDWCIQVVSAFLKTVRWTRCPFDWH